MHEQVCRFVLTSALIVGTFAGGCTSSSTSLTSPTTDKCQITAASVPSSYPSSGGEGALTIGAPRDCSWSVTLDAAWVSLVGAANGQGEASVAYRVAANPTAAMRSTAIAVGDARAQLSQVGAPCRFSLDRDNARLSAAGGAERVEVTVVDGCAWTASSNLSWVTVSSGQSGSGRGAVGLSVRENTSTARIGTVSIAGLSYTVAQDGAGEPNPPNPSPTPTPAPTPTPT